MRLNVKGEIAAVTRPPYVAPRCYAEGLPRSSSVHAGAAGGRGSDAAMVFRGLRQPVFIAPAWVARAGRAAKGTRASRRDGQC